MQQRFVHARQRYQRAQNVLGEAAAIEQAVERLRELREVLPKMHEITVLRGQSHQADEQLRGYTSLREQQSGQLAQKDSALKQARDKRLTLHNQIARDEALHREVAAGLRQTNGQLIKLQECERQEQDLGQLRDDLRRLPADPAAQAAQAREAFERLEGLARLVPVLSRFQTKRDELGRQTEQGRNIEEQQQQVRARGEERKREVEALRPRVEEAGRRLHEASDQATEARTLLAQAKESLQELVQLGSSSRCRHCGQELTPGHLGEEKRRRAAVLQAAETRSKQTAEALDASRKEERLLREQLATAEKAYQEERDAYRDGNLHIKQAKAAVERLQEECANHYADLPEPYRGKVSPAPVADWLTTSYPTPADVEGLKGQARTLEAARRQKQQAEECLQALGPIESPGSDDAGEPQSADARRPHGSAGAAAGARRARGAEKALFKSVDASREQVREVERETERLTRERDQAQVSIGQTDARIKEQELVRQNAQRGIANMMKSLQPAWHPRAETVGIRELHTLRAELSDLEQKGTDESGRELEQARHGLEVMRQDIVQIEAQQAKYPVDARQDPGAIQVHLREAKLEDARCDEQLGQARQQQALLESYRQQREQLDEEYRVLEKDLQSHRLLAELLGANGCSCFWCVRPSVRWWSTPTPCWIVCLAANCI